MITSLYIRNVALIDSLEIELKPGLTVLTGETGAGKSIIIDAVNMALGERASKDLVKHGEDKAHVDAVFDLSGCSAATALLDELELASGDDTLILTREITASGKTVSRVNGIMTPLATVKRISDLLIDVHGQHEHQSILVSSRHMGFVDGYCHELIAPLAATTAKRYEEYSSIRKELSGGFASPAEREREMDMLAYQLNEINSAKLKDGEDEQLGRERTLLRNAETIMDALEKAYSLLSDGDSPALSNTSEAMHLTASISHLAPEYSDLSDKLSDAYYSLEDVSYTLRDLKNAFEYDPKRLDFIESRLDVISGLKRKYGASIADVLSFRDTAKARLDALMAADERISKLDGLLKEAANSYHEAASELSAARHTAADKLTSAITSQLHDLGIAHAVFTVDFSQTDDSVIARSGFDKLEFMLSANAGEPLKPLAKVASGGEASRIMLAFKAILAETDDIQTMIFDEIDTGISGRIASIVGDKMISIASSRQVLCITHLPQIAACADWHFLVRKLDDGETTRTDVSLLSGEARVRQLASLMGGADASDAGIAHAREMLDRAKRNA